MSDLSVELDQLISAEHFSQSVADQARSELQSLANEVDQVLGSAWKGASARAFSESWQDLLPGAEQVIAALEETARLFGATAQRYAEQEHSNAVLLRTVDHEVTQ